LNNKEKMIKADAHFRQQALLWANEFDTVCLLDNNEAQNAFGLHDVDFAVAVGALDEVKGNGHNDWQKFKDFNDKYFESTPMFGYLGYDLKNQLEALGSNQPDGIGFAPMYFFVPQHVLLFDSHGQLMVLSEDAEGIIQAIKSIRFEPSAAPTKLNITQKIDRETYIKTVKQIQEHIVAGDVYELNYCVEFFAENVQLNPLDVYRRLSEISPAPFASFLKLNQQYVMCASPERFLKKASDKLYSQPIKGTARRASNFEEDEKIKAALLACEKERAENLMIVDLVRNDLAKSSEIGSVAVDELFGIYSFKQVHQMISTVSSTLSLAVHPIDAIANAFPMGSMTGAPKVRAMQLIETFENTKRGLYSGAIGYLAPNGDFDFNVVIRSIQYNQKTGYLNFMVGSAITFDAIPEKEYEECLLKAKAMLQALNAI
jgi:para-aminobenzoate synthetase component 1